MTTEQKPVTVAELIAHLQQFPGDTLVAYYRYSESALLELSDVTLEKACKARPDGWVHSARPDKPNVDYVMFPGN